MNDTGERTRVFFAMTADGMAGALRPVHDELMRFRRAVKAVEPVNYHITLQFLGDTGQDTLNQLRGEFRGLEPGIPALPFTLKGLGAFPNIRRPSVLWCGLDLDMSVIERARSMVEDLTGRHGFIKETRPFKPHLTLGRVRKEVKLPPECADYVAANRDTVFGALRFDRIILFKSELRRDGPLYTALEEKALR